MRAGPKAPEPTAFAGENVGRFSLCTCERANTKTSGTVFLASFERSLLTKRLHFSSKRPTQAGKRRRKERDFLHQFYYCDDLRTTLSAVSKWLGELQHITPTSR